MFTWDAATREGLCGWVKNLPDGRVEILAEGETAALQRFEFHLRSGPRGSRVIDVDVSEEAAAGTTTSFDIE
jgi:acylphosphatase